MKRIFLCGFYGCGNLGDDAILLALIKGFRTVIPDVELICSIGADANFLRGLDSEAAKVRTVPRMQFPALLCAIRESDMTVLGGGSLLQNATGTRSLCYYLSVLRVAQRFRKKTAILAGGLGPIDGAFPRRMTASVLKRLDYASFRDRIAAQTAAALGVASPRVSADPALLLRSGRASHPLPAEHFFLVALRKRTGVSVSESTEKILDIARRIGAPPVFCDLFPKEDAAYTAAVLRAYRQSTGTEAIYFPVASPEALSAVIRGARLVYTARYHAALFAYAEGIPLETVGNDPKLCAIARETRSPKEARTVLCSDLLRFSEIFSEKL